MDNINIDDMKIDENEIEINEIKQNLHNEIYEIKIKMQELEGQLMNIKDQMAECDTTKKLEKSFSLLKNVYELLSKLCTK
jgi:hypothetical protein